MSKKTSMPKKKDYQSSIEYTPNDNVNFKRYRDRLIEIISILALGSSIIVFFLSLLYDDPYFFISIFSATLCIMMIFLNKKQKHIISANFFLNSMIALISYVGLRSGDVFVLQWFPILLIFCAIILNLIPTILLFIYQIIFIIILTNMGILSWGPRQDPVTNLYFATDIMVMLPVICTSFILGLIINQIIFKIIKKQEQTQKELKKNNKLLKETKELYAQSQKMEALGQFSGQIAHDFNNLLTVIRGYSDFALSTIQEDDQYYQYFFEINQASIKATNFTKELLGFSRNDTSTTKMVDLNQILKDQTTLVKKLIGENIGLDYNLLKSDLFINADPSELERVLMNLCSNSRDACGSTGKITITTNSINSEQLNVFDESLQKISSKKYAILSVSDNGTGMSKDTQKHIFEPFYTTKPQGKGTGLGLPSAYSIIDKYNGFINVTSQLGVGTTFNIYLPICSTQNLSIQDERASKPQNFEKIVADQEIIDNNFIVLSEDQEAVRIYLEEILVKRGYKLKCFSNGLDALQFCKREHEKIDLIISDVIMPKLSGKELTEEILNLSTDMKFLLISGFTGKFALGDILSEENNIHFLQKPFDSTKFLVKVEEILRENSN